MYVDTNEQPLTSHHTKKRSMVVDDEYDITFTLQAGLEDGGFGVDAFTPPELALSSFKPGLYAFASLWRLMTHVYPLLP
jgi:DNA-binding response OmpR family regulator